MIYNGTSFDNKSKLASQLNLFYKNIALKITERLMRPYIPQIFTCKRLHPLLTP